MKATPSKSKPSPYARDFSANAVRPRFASRLRCIVLAAASAFLPVLPSSFSYADTVASILPSHDAGLRRTALPPEARPGLPEGIGANGPSFAGFGIDAGTRTPSFWAYAPERCSMGLFGKASLEDGRWTYLGAFDAAESLTHCTMSRSGDFRFFKMAGMDADDDGDGVPDSIASLCVEGDASQGHDGESSAAALPVSPRLSATPLPKGETAVLAETSRFLYSGPNPVQTGVEVEALVPGRISVVRGRVLDGNGSPLFGATVTVHGHPEFGETISRADGWYDMVVNGNADLTIGFSAPSVIPAFRSVHPVAQRYAVADDVRLVAFDPVATTVHFGEALDSACLAASGTVTDYSGTRTAVLVFPAGTRAFSVEGAVTQRVDRLTVRMTEFTVGDGGPERMPAELPPTTAYTYCVELSADEASHVVFDRQIFGYIENFVGIPVGCIVPSAFYDFRRDVPAWVPEEDGRVIGIVGASPDGLAEIDLDGDGAAEPLNSLLEFGFSEDELRLLASRYEVGSGLWRVPLEHFSAVDWNYPAYVGGGAEIEPTVSDDNVSEAIQSVDAATEDGLDTGGRVGLHSRTFVETLPICGTGMNLVYSSDRAVSAGSLAAQFSFDVTGDDIPASLKCVRAELDVAGRRYTESFDPLTNIVWRCPWDGMDPYGRAVSGVQPATLRICYGYDRYYAAMRYPEYADKRYTFAQFAELSDLYCVATVRRPYELESSADFEVRLGRRDPLFSEWSVDVQHSYDPVSGRLYLGSGETLEAATTASLREAGRIAGTGERGSVEESGNGLARFSMLDTPTAVCVGPDGELYIADSGNCCIRVVDRSGRIRTYAGRPGEKGCGGDGGSALDATFSWPCALALDPAGNLYVADRDANMVRMVDRSGTIHAVAGNGDADAGGDGGFAAAAAIGRPTALAVARDGTIYVAHGCDGRRVRRIAPDGRVSTVLGGGEDYVGAVDAASATSVDLDCVDITSLAVAGDGRVWITRSWDPYVLCLDNAGVVRCMDVGEEETPLYRSKASGSGQIRRERAGAVGVSRDFFVCARGNDVWLNQYVALGSFYSDSYLMRLGNGGEWSVVAHFGSHESGLPSLACHSHGIPDMDDMGTIYMVSSDEDIVHSFSPSMPSFDGSSIAIPSRDGSQLYVFGPTGRHLETRDAMSRELLLKFGYAEDGSLSSIMDHDGLVTTFERADGRVVVTAPHGQVTTVDLDGSGRPSVVTNPAGERNVLEYTDEGLLTGVSNRRGHVFRQAYDELGKTVSNLDPDGGSNTFSAVAGSSDSGTGWETTVVDGMGRTNILSVLRRKDGLEVRTEIGPDGLCTATTNYTDGAAIVVAPDGSSSYSKLAPDPRFGMIAPYVSRSEVTTEFGKLLVTETERSAAFADMADAYSATNICDTVTRNGRAWRTERDADSLTEVTPTGRRYRTVFNSIGQPLVVESPGVFAVTNVYDAEGRLVRTVQGDRETTFAYDDAGCLASVTDALGRSVSNAYDAVGRAIRSTLPDGSSVSNAYDRSESPVSTTLPHGETHAFGWTPVGLPASYTAPEAPDAGRRLERAYNAAREQTALVKPDGTVVSNIYDSAGRLAAVVAVRGDEIERRDLAYDHAGRLQSVRSGYAETGYCYDSFLQIGEDSGGLHTDFEYDEDFRVSKTTYSSYWLGGSDPLAKIGVSYDDDGDVVKVGALSVNRNPVTGFVESTGLGGVFDWRCYSGYGECTNYVASFEGDDLYQASFKRDRLGRVVEREERVLSGETVTSRYEYDERGRLVSVTTNSVVAESYSYDANGNRLGGVYDAQDRQLAYGGETNAYDLNGSMTNRNGVALTWNLFGRLVSVGDVSYWRDELQRLCYKDVADEPVKNWYWSGSRIVAEYDYISDQISVFVYAGVTAPAYMIRGDVTYRIITDNQGSVRLVVNAETGEVMQRLDYDSFGRVLRDTNPGFQPFGFQGGLYDPDTGLVEFGCRWYDAETGRWISKDPILLEGGWNVYAFCDNDPINRIDPSGLARVVIEDVSGGRNVLYNPSLDEYVEAITDYDQGSISRMIIYGHGAAVPWSEHAGLIRFNKTDSISLDLDDRVVFDNGSSFSDVVRPKMARNGTIYLAGCLTACDGFWFWQQDNNISRFLSEELPDINVIGHKRLALGFGEWYGIEYSKETWCRGKQVTYRNGVRK